LTGKVSTTVCEPLFRAKQVTWPHAGSSGGATPPFPSYTSGHSTFSAAAATVLAGFFGTDGVRFTATSEGVPGVSRSFAGFWDAAWEAGQSRIYGGIHWQFDNAEGLTCGRKVGRYVVENVLGRRVPCPCVELTALGLNPRPEAGRAGPARALVATRPSRHAGNR
jgi:hypothetical protein